MSGEGDVSIVAGSDGNARCYGPAMKSSFTQPTGIAMENNSIFICDTGNNSVLLVANCHAMAIFLENIGNLYDVFSIHTNTTKSLE